MRITLKSLHDQVVVITGASSGIGLTTAHEAASRGARVVLSSRDDEALQQAVEAIRDAGGTATWVVADVADPDQVQAIVDEALATFGRIDTWVNNAGVTIYGRLEDVSMEDARRLFDTNYWGIVHGSLAAVPHLRAQGGALINIGSALSDTAMPLQGHYSASKHAVKGFTDALRLELEKEGAPISVTLVKPASIDTPYPDRARNYLMAEPTQQAPVYAPEVVADAILAAAQSPRRDVRAGGASKVISTMQTLTPRLADRFKKATSFDAQLSDEPPNGGDDTLYAPRTGDLRTRGRYKGRVLQRSAYTSATTAVSLNPLAAVVGALAVGVGVALTSPRRR